MVKDCAYIRVGVETKIEHIDYWDFFDLKEALDFYEQLECEKGVSAKYIEVVSKIDYDEEEIIILLKTEGYYELQRGCR